MTEIKITDLEQINKLNIVLDYNGTLAIGRLIISDLKKKPNNIH